MGSETRAKHPVESVPMSTAIAHRLSDMKIRPRPSFRQAILSELSSTLCKRTPRPASGNVGTSIDIASSHRRCLDTERLGEPWGSLVRHLSQADGPGQRAPEKSKTRRECKQRQRPASASSIPEQL